LHPHVTQLAHLIPIHWLPAGVFLVTYFLIAVESNTATYLDRTAAAFIGAVAMVVTRSITLNEAYQSIDWNTIIFLLGIMILVAHFRVSGFFDWIAFHVARLARTRFQLLVLLIFTAGLLSAFFVNDTICLIFTPIVLTVTGRLDVPPVPYIIALATSANIGSSMSITGNPQNALIGVSGKFSFLGFLAHLAPVGLVGLMLNVGLLAILFRKELAGRPLELPEKSFDVKVDPLLLAKCAFAAALVVVLWIMNFSFPLVAASVGALILVIGRVKSEFIHRNIDWTLLLFFASLFVVIRGFEQSGAIDILIHHFQPWLRGSATTQLCVLSGIMVVLSNLVSNVPAVLVFRPVVETLQHGRLAWLALAASSTLAGNFTPFSSVANLIVLQQASKKVTVTFWDFTKIGLVVTLVTTLASILILALEFRVLPGF
jgi:Na+/H+ antiporter NhaD/arsenite permease-like protein